MSIEEDVQVLVNAGRFMDAVALAATQAANALQIAALISSRIGNQEETARFAQLSVDVDPKNPHLHGNLSYFLGNQWRTVEALDAIDKAIELAPDIAEFYCNRAVILASLRRVDDAIESYRTALEKNPDCHFAKFNLGTMLMMRGEYKEGLEALETRFIYDADLTKFRERFTQPDWDGKTSLKGKRLLVYSEQGAGDVIQYVRYIPLLKDAFLIAEIQEELVPLLRNFFDITIGRSQDYNTQEQPNFPEHDYVVSFASLAHLLDPELKNIPKTPYLNVEPLELSFRNKFNIGIVWAGSPNHPNDQERNCPAKYLIPISKVPKVQLYSLQKGNSKRNYWDEIIDFKEGYERLGAIDLSKVLDNFYKTAQVISKLDLVISVDTAVAHLAGALGKPVWVMLPFCHDHRWLVVKNDRLEESKVTPFYSTMRLFHQPDVGDWGSIVAEITKELVKMRS